MTKITTMLVWGILLACLGLRSWPEAGSVPKPPYGPSPVIRDVSWDFSKVSRLAPGSDLWPVTWAADDKLYTSWGDGGGFGGTNQDGRVSLGFGRIEGAPTDFTAANIWGGKNSLRRASFKGKSTGIISVEGTLYAWINLQNSKTPDFKLAWSSDLGASWQLSSWSFSSSVFAPSTILNFGKDYADARDAFVYSYGGGWGHTKTMELVRVPRDRIKDRTAYEFYGGLDARGLPHWTSDITRRQAVFVDPKLADELNGALKGSVIHHPGVKRYILTIPHGGVGRLGIFDAPEPWGPWTTIAYYGNWGRYGNREALVYALPTKWMSADGQTVWMIFSSTGKLDAFNLVKGSFALNP